MSTQTLYLGSLNSMQGFNTTGAQLSSNTGLAVSNAGDVNGDGLDDILIGADRATYVSNSADTGIIYLIWGSKNIGGSVNLANLGNSGVYLYQYKAGSSGYIGGTNTFSGIGDINGDGYDDISLVSGEGAATYVLYGNSSFTQSINVINIGSTIPGIYIPWVSSSTSLSKAGSLNGDQYADIMIFSSSGIYVIYGSSSLPSSISLNNVGKTISGFTITGFSSMPILNAAGDVNKDGFNDILVGLSNVNSNTGEVYTVYCNNTLPKTFSINNVGKTINGFYITGPASGSAFGASISGVGDSNGDGFADISIGAPNYNSNAGVVYVIYGNSSLPASMQASQIGTKVQGFYTYGPSSNNYCGTSVSAAGDVNGDKFTDIIFGCSGETNGNGGTFLLYGGKNYSHINIAALNSTYGYSTKGTYYSNAGSSVGGFANINGDEYADTIIGAPEAGWYINSQAKPEYFGGAYVVYGSATGFNILSPTLAPTTHAPSYLPTFLPTTSTVTQHPSYVPTVAPSYVPSKVPTNIPTCDPTSTHLPTIFPTHSPTKAPSNLPTLTPTFAPSEATYITSGGSYNVSGSNQNYIIDTNSDVTLYGSGTNNMFTFEKNSNTLTTINNFNNYTDLINLKDCNVYDYNQLNITAGSVIITLDNNQIIKLLELTPNDITANNFVFAVDNSAQSESASLSSGAIAGIAVATTFFCAVAGYFGYAYFNQVWPFNMADIVGKTAELTTVANPVIENA